MITSSFSGAHESVKSEGGTASAPESPMLRAALTYARRGWQLVPLHISLLNGSCSCKRPACGHVGKHPVTPRGHTEATSEEATIRDWWAPSQIGDANIGIACAASGLVVVDVDGPHGRELLARVLDGRELPITLRARSGRAGGGEHVYFAAPPGVRFARTFFDGDLGLEIKHRGYVVAPPSLHYSGQRYAWLDSTIEPAPAPDWLLARAKSRSTLISMPKATSATAPKHAAGPALAPSPREYDDVDLTDVRSRLRNLRDPDTRAAMALVLGGQPFASPGSRNPTAYRLTSVIAGVCPTGDPVRLAEIFRASLAAMAMVSPLDNPAPTVPEVEDMIRRSQDDLRTKPDPLRTWVDQIRGRTGGSPSVATAPTSRRDSSAARWLPRPGSAAAILPTGFGSLDAASRGGWRVGGLVVIVGAPGAAKTMLVTQLAVHYASNHYVALLAADEGAEGVAIRIAQQCGLDRDRVERGEDYDRAAAVLLALDKLQLLDAVVDDVGIEDAVAELRRRAGNEPAVLIVDSIQTARATGSATADGPRDRINAIVAALKRAARTGLLVIATSEAARRNYISDRSRRENDPLAAGKESGDIEYAAHIQLVLTSAKEEYGVVEVTTAKNRWGQRLPARFKIDFERATLTEIKVSIPNSVGELMDPARHRRDQQRAADIARVRAVLAAQPGLGIRDLYAAINGMGKPRVDTAVAALRLAGELETRRDGQRHRLLLARGAQQADSSSGHDCGASDSPASSASPPSPASPDRPGDGRVPSVPSVPRPIGTGTLLGTVSGHSPDPNTAEGVGAAIPPDATRAGRSLHDRYQIRRGLPAGGTVARMLRRSRTQSCLGIMQCALVCFDGLGMPGHPAFAISDVAQVNGRLRVSRQTESQ